MKVMYYVKPENFEHTHIHLSSTVPIAVSSFCSAIDTLGQAYFWGVPSIVGSLYSSTPVGDTFISNITIPNVHYVKCDEKIAGKVNSVEGDTPKAKDRVPDIALACCVNEKQGQSTEDLESALFSKVCYELLSMCHGLVEKHLSHESPAITSDDLIRAIHSELRDAVKEKYSIAPIIGNVLLMFCGGRPQFIFHAYLGGKSMSSTQAVEACGKGGVDVWLYMNPISLNQND